MTKFYIIGSSDGTVLSCKTKLKEAKQYLDVMCNNRGTITMVEVPVTAESVRLLLGNLGGYAFNSREIFCK